MNTRICSWWLCSTLVLLFATTHICFAQTPDPSRYEDDGSPKIFSYRFLTSVAVTEIYMNGTTSATRLLAPSGAIFTVLGTVGDSYLIQFYQWTTSADLTSNYQLFNAVGEKQDGAGSQQTTKLFLAKKADVEERASKYYAAGDASLSWTYGAVVIPVKLRWSPSFVFSKDFTLGTAFGGKMRLSHNAPTYLSLLASFGLTSVTLDSASTQGTVLQSSDRAAFTFATGLVLEFSGAQVGIFGGWDWISQRSDQRTWIYQGQPWLSLGIGFSILSRQTAPEAKGGGTQ